MANTVTQGPGRASHSYPTATQLEEWAVVPADVDVTCDVLVVGGGLSGVAAAVAAARRKVDVVLTEPGHLLGGQATASGVSATDVTQYYRRMLTRHGLWGEIERRTRRIYDEELLRPLGTSQYRDTSFAPNCVVLEHVLGQLLHESGVHVLRNFTVEHVQRERSGIVCAGSGGRARARIVIDGTEDGSLLHAASVSHRLGNVVIGAGEPDPKDASRIGIQFITQAAVVRQYPEGVPDDLLMPAPPPGYAKRRQQISLSYPGGPAPEPGHPNGFAGYRGVPDLMNPDPYRGSQWKSITRTSINYRNDHPVAADFLTDAAARACYEQDAATRTLCVLYYMQHELGLPWSVVTDEGFGDGPPGPPRFPGLEQFAPITRHLPPLPYIRESRRLLGLDTLTGKDVYRRANRTEARWNVDAVAVGTYTVDLHGGRRPEDFEAYLGESLADKPEEWREGPFPIPCGVLISVDDPRVLAAEKNISMSRLANGATRLHPTVVGIGEAVGVLAALAVRNGCSPAEVPVPAVQRALARSGALVAPVSIMGAEPDDRDFVDVSFAVARSLVRHERGVVDGGEPAVVVDLAAAARIGRTMGAELAAGTHRRRDMTSERDRSRRGTCLG